MECADDAADGGTKGGLLNGCKQTIRASMTIPILSLPQMSQLRASSTFVNISRLLRSDAAVIQNQGLGASHVRSGGRECYPYPIHARGSSAHGTAQVTTADNSSQPRTRACLRCVRCMKTSGTPRPLSSEPEARSKGSTGVCKDGQKGMEGA